MDRTAEIPEIPEQLTAAWLETVLGWRIHGVRQSPVGQGQGFMGDIVRLTLDHDEAAAPATLIAKLPKLANRAMGEMLGVYEREVLFFQTYAADFPVRIPRVYFSHYDPDAGSVRQKAILGVCDRLAPFMAAAIGALGRRVAAAKQRRYLILMEDLADFHPGDQFAGADAEACARILEQFAAVHARFWRDDSLGDQFWLLPMDIDARMREQMFRHTLGAFRAEASETLRKYVDWLGANYAALTRKLTAQAPATLVHNDLRLDNICLRDGKCAYLDWQLLRSGPAAYDVAYFLGGALDEQAGWEAELGILKRYHAALGRADYEFERFLRDYRRGLVLSLPAVAPHADIAIDAGRGQAMMARWRRRLEARLARVPLETLLED